MKSKLVMLFILSLLIFHAFSQIHTSPNHRYLADKKGKPFFWLGDTDWELFHRLNREEAAHLLEVRSRQGFNVIQAVALAEFAGLHQPNQYGDIPLINNDPAQLNSTPGSNAADAEEYDYWDHVDYIIKTAADKGLYIGLLPTWGDKVAHLWGDGPIIFTEQNAYAYAHTLALRYKNQWNIIWILGGDRPVMYEKGKDGQPYDDRSIWEAMARGIQSVFGKDVFIAYHPAGGDYSTSQYLQQASWLSLNAFQSGHGSREVAAWQWVTRDQSYTPLKPVLDMEPCYEDHPVNPWDGHWTKQRGYFTAYDVRARIYRGVFAGACGVTYGHHQVWQFMDTGRNEAVNPGDTIIPWRQAILSEAATEMHHLKNLMLSYPYFSRVRDESLVLSDTGITYTDHIEATKGSDGSYAMIYLPQNKPVTVDLNKISGNKKYYWFDVRTGKKNTATASNAPNTFTPPAAQKDWVLIIEDASKHYDM